MRLYTGSSQQFINDAQNNTIAEKLKTAFKYYYRYEPSNAELMSWRNSLLRLSLDFSTAGLTDHGVILEYQLPVSSKRLDCLICGKNGSNEDNAVIIELKQWQKCEEAEGKNEVIITWVGRDDREVLHPSVQVGRYKSYLEDTHTAFYEGSSPIRLNACAYLHNYAYIKGDPLLDNKFQEEINNFPLFTVDDTDAFQNYLIEKLENGKGTDVLKRIDKSKYRPSKKLMDHVSKIIKNEPEFILLDEQQVVYDRILVEAQKGFKNRKKVVVLIKGRPGTGKSVIAINLMADLLCNGFNAHYATGSRAFTETLRSKIGSRGSVQFKYFNSYRDAELNEIDVLICDEAHRIREVSENRFTKKQFRTGKPQIHELIDASKVSVFFIDDAQVVRPNEIGSVALIKQASIEKDARLYEYELQAQFRCEGSDAFVNWIDNTLGICKTANILWTGHEGFDFKIFDDPFSLKDAIFKKQEEGFTSRIAAGFCWEWSDPDRNGNLVDDVQIGGFKMPWNAKSEAKRLSSSIPPEKLWATDPRGINQIGCIYTAQGFEYDYAGVIFGLDLIYSPLSSCWIGQREYSQDSVVKRSRDKFTDLVKRSYRVLLSRGMKGCYVYFMDQNTRNFFQSRIDT